MTENVFAPTAINTFRPSFGNIRLPAVTGDGSLQDVVDSTVFDLDATQSASYPGSGQTWANLVTAPADGASQTDYDMWLGLDETVAGGDPAFTGSAGDAAAYFAIDGSAFFGNKTTTSFLKSIHKTTGGSDFWFLIAFRCPNGATTQCLAATNAAPTSPGWRVQLNSSENISFVQRGDTASAASSTYQLVATTDYLALVSFSHANGNYRIWINTTTKTDEAEAFNATTTDSAGFGIAAEPVDAGGALANGARIYAVAMGNAYIDDAEAALIFDALETRHGRDYTP